MPQSTSPAPARLNPLLSEVVDLCVRDLAEAEEACSMQFNLCQDPNAGVLAKAFANARAELLRAQAVCS